MTAVVLNLSQTTLSIDCKKGGLVSLRHKEVRNLLCELSSMAWSNVVKKTINEEPSLNPLARASSMICLYKVSGKGNALPCSMFMFVDSDSPSYSDKSPQSVLLAIAEREKKRNMLPHVSYTIVVSLHSALQ